MTSCTNSFIMSKTNASDIAIYEVISIKDTTHYMSEKQTTKFVVSKSTHYKTFVESKAGITNF